MSRRLGMFLYGVCIGCWITVVVALLVGELV